MDIIKIDTKDFIYIKEIIRLRTIGNTNYLYARTLGMIKVIQLSEDDAIKNHERISNQLSTNNIYEKM